MSLLSPRFDRCFCALWCALFTTLLQPILPAAYAAAVPEFMTYQGFLVDGNGNPLATNAPANYPVIFSIWDAQTAGNRIWTEQQIVTVDRGNFSVQLGEGSPIQGLDRPSLPLVFSSAKPEDRFMELSVTITAGSTPVTLLPRLRLLPAPYAFLATSASKLVTPNGATVLDTSNGKIVGDGSGLHSLTASQIPLLTVDKIPTLTGDKIPSYMSGDRAFDGKVTIGPESGATTADTTLRLTRGGILMHNPFGLLFLEPSNLGLSSGIMGGSGNSLTLFTYAGALLPRLTINGNGNVGIGTTSPAYKLEVEGNMKVASDL